MAQHDDSNHAPVNPNAGSHYIGVDVGTGSARACIIDDKGNLLATASEDIQTWQSQPGCYEQSTHDIWTGICTSVKTIIKQTNVDKRFIRSIVFVATCSLAVFAGDTDEPMPVNMPHFADTDHDVLLWMHSAAQNEARVINDMKNDAMKYLGGSVSPLMALPKVLWLKNNMPTHLFHRSKFFDLHDALAHIATRSNRRPCVEPCNNLVEQRGFGIDGSIKGWSEQILNDINLRELSLKTSRQVGGICEHGRTPAPGSPSGTLCPEAAEQLGLPQSVIVGSGTIDSYTGWIGTTGAQIECSDPKYNFAIHERLATVAGTTTCHILASNQAKFTSGVWGPYKDFLIPGYEVMEGGQNATGRLIQHVLETHPAYNEATNLAKSRDLSIFDFCNEQLQQRQKSTSASNITYLGRHIFFYGDYFGNRSPYSDPDMTGSVAGLTGDTNVDNLVLMYYSALEFIALQTRHIISAMNQSGHAIRSIYMSGSLCLNKILMDLISTTCDMPVIIPKYVNAAVVYGAALLAVKSSTSDREGNTEDLWSVMKRMSKLGKVVLPQQDQYMKDLLEVKYKIFLEQAERQRVFRGMIDKVRRDPDAS